MCNLGLHIKIFRYNMESKSCLDFHVCMAYVENMATMVFGENKKCESEACITQLLTHYDVHGTINPRKIIESFKAHGNEKVVDTFNNFKPNDAWIKYLWFTIVNLVSN